jgi:hypothetical protein
VQPQILSGPNKLGFAPYPWRSTHERASHIERNPSSTPPPGQTQKKKRHERLLNTTGRDLVEVLETDLSAFSRGLAQIGTRREAEPEGVPLPELPSDEVVGPYESEAGVRLLLFARDAGAPVLVEFGYKPPEVYEDNLRHSAKIRACRLYFYRLIDGNVAIEVEPKAPPSNRDASFLRRLGINVM